jgi:methyl-accepting chemotaxis protein
LRWTINLKLTSVFVFVALMMGGGTSVAYLAQLRGQTTERQVARTTAILKDLEYLNSYVRAVTAMQRAFLISGDEKAVAPIPALRKDANAVIQRVGDAVAANPEQAAHFESWKQLLLLRRAFTDKLLAARRNDGFDAAKAIFDTGEDNVLYEKMQTEVAEASHLASAQLDAEQSANTAFQHLVGLTELVGTLFAIGLLGFIGFRLIRSIGHDSKTAVRLVEAMAQKNLAMDDGIPIANDELADAILSINAMKRAMAEAIDEVSQSSTRVDSVGIEIEAATKQIVDTTHSQKNHIGQFAASLEEMSISVKEIAGHSEQAAAAASQAVSSARDGRNVVHETQDAMNKIHTSVTASSQDIAALGEITQSIGDVVRIIQGIAEQTNLLALNAAIEAARAGEQGKGFAVVAQEVRQLAERTGSFTKDIAVKVESVQQGAQRAIESMQRGEAEVENGVSQFDRVSGTLDDIVQRIEMAQQGITMIATATTQQSIVAQDVTNTVHEVSSEMEQTAVQMDQTATACTELAKLAAGMQNLVKTFQLPGSSRDSSPRGFRNDPSSRPAQHQRGWRAELLPAKPAHVSPMSH